MMPLQDPDSLAKRRQRFTDAAFIQSLGMTLTDLGPGWAETSLVVQPSHAQQDGFVHAGVQATICDHTAGTAAATLLAADEIILTAEFKINLLRPGTGPLLRCRAEVLKPGKRLTVCESRLYREETLLALAIVTLAVLPKPVMA